MRSYRFESYLIIKITKWVNPNDFCSTGLSGRRDRMEFNEGCTLPSFIYLANGVGHCACDQKVTDYIFQGQQSYVTVGPLSKALKSWLFQVLSDAA